MSCIFSVLEFSSDFFDVVQDVYHHELGGENDLIIYVGGKETRMIQHSSYVRVG